MNRVYKVLFKVRIYIYIINTKYLNLFVKIIKKNHLLNVWLKNMRWISPNRMWEFAYTCTCTTLQSLQTRYLHIEFPFELSLGYFRKDTVQICNSKWCLSNSLYVFYPGISKNHILFDKIKFISNNERFNVWYHVCERLYKVINKLNLKLKANSYYTYLNLIWM